MGGPELFPDFFLLIALLLVCCALYFYWLSTRRGSPRLERHDGNPVLAPDPAHWWENQAVFNPGAVVHDGRVHLFYRAMGPDGLSRVGYASSADGIHFERLPYPVFEGENRVEAASHHPYTSPARLTYDQAAYASGGGWGGAEDPRAVKLEGKIYLTFNMFNGWDSMRVGLTSLDEAHLTRGRFNWRRPWYLSRPRERHKNWVLFPEKINGKYALLHSIYGYGDDETKVRVQYMDELTSDFAPYQNESTDPQQMPDKKIAWHQHMRSASAPPLKTKDGWLVFYHASDHDWQIGYKLGAMLLDLNDPTKIIARSSEPVLEPKEWYENDWKPGVIIASGAVIFNGDLIIYYGGGDKYVAAARANLDDFLHKLTSHEHAVLEPVKV